MKTILVAIFLMTALAGQVNAGERNCAPKQAVVDELAKKFGEIAFASGIATGNSVKFFGNAHTGSWTMVMIRPDGYACILATGDGLEVLTLALAENAAL